MGTIPPDIQKTVARLRNEAAEKMRLADDIERHYTGEDPKQRVIRTVERDGFFPASELVDEATVESLIAYLKNKSGRPFDLAKAFHVSEEKINQLISSSGGKLTIPDWRGWVKLGKHK